MTTDLKDPFVTGYFNGRPYGAVTVDDRLAMVRKMTKSQLRAALNIPDLQKTVRTAIERRLRKFKP